MDVWDVAAMHPFDKEKGKYVCMPSVLRKRLSPGQPFPAANKRSIIALFWGEMVHVNKLFKG